MRFNHKFWLGGPIETRSMRPNCILQILFRDLKDPVKCISATMTKKRTLQSKAMTKSHLLTIYNVKPTVLAQSFCGSLKLKKMWCQDCVAMVKKNYKIPKKVLLGHPATECYWMICTISRMPIIPDVQLPRDQVFEELRRAVELHGRLVSTGEKNRRVGKKWCQVFWEMKCLTP